MPSRTLVLLSSLRPSSKYRQTIHIDEVEAFWHGYLALWHPHVVAESAGPPTLGTQEEFEPLVADHLFVMPQTPYHYHATDWQEHQRSSGSLVISSVPSWNETISNLAQAMGRPVELFQHDWLAFAGLGMGYLLLEAYCDAQDHTNPLDCVSFYDLIRQAALTDNPDDREHHLGQAAHRLQEAREVVNPSQLYQAVTLFLNGSASESKLKEWVDSGLSFTIVGTSSWLEAWRTAHPQEAEQLKKQLQSGTVDWWGGAERDQDDALLPMSAWLMNLHEGLQQAKAWTGRRLESAGRSPFAATPTMPTLLQSFHIKRALGFSNDTGIWPHATNSLMAWRGPDSQLLESCTRKPEPLESLETAFHLSHLLYEAGTSEYVGWLHLGIMRGSLELPLWFRCWRELHRLAPVFGHLGNLEQTIRDIPATEQFVPASADDYQSDYLLELTGQCDAQAQPNPISRFAVAQERWREWESSRTLLSLTSAIVTDYDATERTQQLEQQGKQLLNQPATPPVETTTSEMAALTRRLISSAGARAPGYLCINTCSFSRKVPVQLANATTLLPAPAWASQKAEQGIDAVIEVPPLGFAWIPCAVEKGAKVRLPKATIVQGTMLQNDYIMLEVDPATGGIRSIRDSYKQLPRLGQQLVFAPGSSMICEGMTTLRNGHAVGEIQTHGTLVDAHGKTLATFRQTHRLWAGSKLAEVDIQLEPVEPTIGYPWHAYYACRWAWRDPHTRLHKSIHQTKLLTQQTRPETPGFIELELTQGKTTIFSRGYPFWQRHSSRMLDSLLIVEGETARDFSFAISLDDDLPHQTAQHWQTPLLTIPTEGLPTAGNTGWFFHVDAPSVLVINMHPVKSGRRKIIVRMVETYGYATEAMLLCPHPPKSAQVVDSWGEVKQELRVTIEGVALHLGCYEFQQVALEF